MRKMKFDFRKGLSIGLFASFFVIANISCQIGLGEAVDVEPPEISITDPQPSLTIRSAFTVSGEVKDDGEVKDIILSLKNTETQASFKGFKAEFKQNQGESATWTCVIDPVANKIPDGSYELEAVATDTALRSSLATRGFVVDNTPPVLVFTRPSSSDITNPDMFGQEFSITGQAADDANIDLMEVTIYNTEGTVLKTIPLLNVPPTIDLTVAKWGDGTGFYEALYGNDINAGEKTFYYSVTAYDAARKVPADLADKGNSVTYYYLYNDIYTDVLSTYKLTDVYKIMNGTYKTDDSSRTATVVDILGPGANGRQRVKGSFALNPLNNPSYKLSGYTALTKDGTDFTNSNYQIANGSKVTVQVSAGLDKVPLLNDTLAVYAEACDEKGKGNGTKITLVPPAADLEGNALLTDAEKQTRLGMLAEVGSYDRNFTFVLSNNDNGLTKGLTVGSKYIIYAEGYDENKNPVSSLQGTYGFLLASNGAAPKLEYTINGTSNKTISAVYMKKNHAASDLKITGTAGHEEGLPSVTATINGKVVYGPLNVKNFEFSISAADYVTNVNVSEQCELSIVASYSGVETTYATSVRYDAEGPEAEVTAVSSVTRPDSVTGAGTKECVNGKFTVKGTMADSFGQLDAPSMRWTLYDSDGKTEKESGILGTNFLITVNSALVSDNSDLKLKLSAKDSAGNLTEHWVTGYYVCQASDKPVITLNHKDQIDTNDVLKISKNSNFSASIEDDDKIAQVSVMLYNQNADGSKGSLVNKQDIVNGVIKDIPNVGSSGYSLNASLPNFTGDYIIEVTVTDNNPDGNAQGATTIVSQKMHISGDAPTLTVEDINVVRYLSNQDNKGLKTITIKGTIEGESTSSDPLNIYLCQLTAGAGTATEDDDVYEYPDINRENAGLTPVWTDTTYNVAEQSFVITTNPASFPRNTSGENTPVLFKLVAQDTNGVMSEKVLKYAIDNTAPTVTITSPATGKTGVNSETSVNPILKGTTADTGSKVAAVYYAFDTEPALPALADRLDSAKWEEKTWTLFSGVSNWNDSPAVSEGSHILYVRCVDNAGNVSTQTSRAFDVDQNYPTVTISAKGTRDSVISGGSTKDTGLYFTYTAEDSYGLAANQPVITIEKDGAALANTAYKVDSTNKKITFVNAPGATTPDGAYKVTVSAKDKFDKVTTKTLDMNLDAKGPVINVTSHNFGTDNWQRSTAFSVNGTASDGSGVSAVYFATTNAPIPTGDPLGAANWTGWTKASNTTNWTASLSGLTEGSGGVIKFAAVDTLGNVSVQTGTLNIDTTVPTVKVYKADGSTEIKGNVQTNSDYTFVVNPSDSGSGVNKVEVSGSGITTVDITTTKDSNGYYKYTLPAASDTSKTYNLKFTVSDKAGNSDSKEVEIVVDTKAPTVTITSPIANTWQNTAGTVAIAGSANGTGTDVAKVYYRTSSGSVPTGDLLDSSKWTSAGWTAVTNGTDNWSFGQDISDEGKNVATVYVAAVDAVGNVSEVVSRSINLDKNPPALSITSEKGGLPANGMTLTGTASDTYKLSKVEITQWYAADGSISGYGTTIKIPTSGTSYSINQLIPFKVENEVVSQDTVNDGTYRYKIVVTDAAGKTAEDTFDLIGDKTPPTVTVTTPSSSSSNTGLNAVNVTNFRFEGTTTDGTGTGVSNIYYQITTSAEKPLENDANWRTSIGGTLASWNFSEAFKAKGAAGSGDEEGTYYLHVFAKDKAGNSSYGDTITRKFDVDLAYPAVTISAKGTDDSTISATSTKDKGLYFTYKASDTNGLAAAQPVITIEKDGTKLTAGADKDYTVDSGKITLASATDGAYKVIVSATDVVGKKTEQTAEIRLDTSAPVVSITTPTDTNLDNWFTNSSIRFEGTAADPSSVAKVEYSTDDGSTWVEATGTTNWYFTLNQANTTGQQIKIRAEDNLGNQTARGSELTKTVKVDTEKPAVSDVAVSKPLLGQTEITALSANPATPVSFSATVASTTSGISSVHLYEGSTDHGAMSLINGKYSISLNKASVFTEGNHSFTVVATNGAETSFTSDAVSVYVDTTAPTVSGITVSPTVDVDGVDKVNGTVKITVTVEDNHKLGNTLTWSFGNGNGQSGSETVSGTYKTLSFTVDTTKLTTATAQKTLTLSVSDDAGNTTTDTTFTLDVDQSTDIPRYTSSNASGSTAAENLFGMGNWVINGTVTDDDGVAKVEVKLDDAADYSIAFDATKDSNGQAISNPVYKTSKAFNYTIADSVAEGAHTLSVRVTDKNGKTNVQTVNNVDTCMDTVLFAVDKSAPVITPEKVGSKTYSSSMFVQASFDLILKASDTNKVSKVEYINGSTATELTRVKEVNGSYVADTYPISSATVYYKDAVSGEEDGNGKTRIYRVTDSYGRTGETTITYNVDTKAPTVIGTSDSTKKISITGGSLSNKTIADLATTWFQSESVTITGATEAVKDTNLSPSVSVGLSGATSGSSSFDMSVTSVPAVGNEGDADYVPAYKSGSFNTNLAITNGSTAVTLTFADEAGNTKPLILNVKADNVAPTVKDISLSFDGSVIGSTSVIHPTETKKITIKFSAADATSGLSKATITHSNMGRAAGQDVTLSSGSGASTTYPNSITAKTVEYDASSLPEGTNELFITLEDAAGNVMQSTSLGSFIIDSTPPAVTFDAMHDADDTVAETQVNKTITISGTVTDANLDSNATPVLYIDSSATPATGVTATRVSASKWKISGINTTLTGTNAQKLADGSHTFKVCFTDKAGNITLADNVLTLDVKQDSDRPVVALKNLNTNGKTTLSTGTISFNVTDDDGAVDGTAVKVKLEKLKAGSTTEYDVHTDWAAATLLDSGEWKFDIPKKAGETKNDGNYRVYFQVTDKNGGQFTSSAYTSAQNTDALKAAADLSKPKLKYEDGAAISTPITFSVDTEAPEITGNKVYIEYTTDTSETDDAKRTYAKEDTTGELSNNKYLGGTKYPMGKIYIKATDAVTSYNNADFKAVLRGFEANEIVMEKTGSDTFTASGLDFTRFNGYTNLQIVVQEPSGLSAEIKRSVIFDNKEPGADRDIITNASPTAVTQVTGDINYTGLVQDDEEVNSGIESIEYYIPKASETNEKAAGIAWKTSNEQNADEAIRLTSMVWNIPKLDMHVQNGVGNNPDTMQNDYKGYETSTDSGIFEIPVWFRVTDKVGNVGYSTSSRLLYNPDGDRPRVNITYPVEDTSLESGKLKDNTTKYVVMGGNVIISGNATDNEAVDSVWLQLDVNGDGVFDYSDNNGSDKKWLETACTAAENTGKKYADLLGVTVENFTLGGTTYTGIKADGTQSWQKIIKLGAQDGTTILLNNLEIGKTGNTENKVFGIRVLAVDSEELNRGTERGQLVSSWSKPLHISVNNSVPVFEDFILNQYSVNASGAKTGSAIASQSYQEDKFISAATGTAWFLEGKITDNNGIKEITASGSVSSNDISRTSVTLGYKVSIPVTGNGAWSVDITAYDNDTSGSKESKMKYTLNIDNTAPAFTEGTVGGEGSNKDDIKIHSGSISGNILNPSTVKVQNSNGTFTIAGKVDEAGSGFERVAFYVKRTGTTDRIYNVMKAPGTNRTENRTNLDASSTTTGGTGVYIDTADNLPLKKVTAATSGGRPSELKITLTAAPDDNVRKGGLIKIGGVYRRITDVSGATIEFDSACPVSYTEAYLVYATLSIDQANDSIKDGSIQETDGDGLVESYSKSGSTYTWDASFDSNNIPDGPIELHFVAFDKAGNKTHGVVHSVVSNNAPRLAKVYLGTDLNQNGNIEASEFSEYKSTTTEMAQEVAMAVDKWNLTTSNFKVKKDLAIVPEFVGGTGTIKMVMSKGATTTDSVTGTGTALIASLTGTDASKVTPATTKSKEWNSGHTALQDINSSFLKFKLTNTQLWGGSNPAEQNSGYTKGTKSYSFTFWDETEELVQGSTTQNAVLLLNDLYLDMVDGVAPTTVVKPFKWISKDDNSLYQNSPNNGHIELEGDLEGGNWTGYTAGAPKVSGRIVFRGTAYDDVCLKDLTFSFGSISGVLATYTAGTGWGNIDSNLKIYTEKDFDTSDANYIKADADAILKAFAQTSTDTVTASDLVYFDQRGHKIAWELTVNTESVISTVAALARTFQVTASDQSENGKGGEGATGAKDLNLTENATATTDVERNIPTYTVDVVPYITKVTTSLDEMSEGNASVYSRTAKGHYSVYDKEILSITGFNLTAGATVTINSEDSNAANKKTATLGSASGGAYPFTLPAGAKSGKVKVTVKVSDTESIDSINNTNDNTAKGSYSGSDVTQMYNCQPNSINNDTLTDDLELDIWEFKTAANPRDGEILTPEMQIGPNGEVGFAFVNGNFYFNMAGPSKVGETSATTNGTFASQRAYEKDYAPYYESAFTYDPSGHTFGISTNQDANDPYSAYTTFYFGRRSGSRNNGTGDGAWKTTSSNYMGGSYRRRLQSTTSTVLTAGNIQDTSVYRAMSPSIAVTTGSNNRTNVYTAFYDAVRKEIRYKYGIVDATSDDFIAGEVETNRTTSGTQGHKFSGKVGNTGVDYYAIDFFDGNDIWAHVLYPGEVIFGGTTENGKLRKWGKNQYEDGDAGYGGGKQVTLFDIDGKVIGTYYTGKNTWSNDSVDEQMFSLHKTNDLDDYAVENNAIHPIPKNAVYICEGNHANDLTLQNVDYYSTITTKTNHGLSTGDIITFSRNIGSYEQQEYITEYYVTKVSDKSFTVSRTAGGKKCVVLPLETTGGWGTRKPTVYISKISGQLKDVSNGWSAAGLYPTKTADSSVDKSVISSLYTVVSKASLTKTTAAVAIGAVPASVANNSSKDVVCVAWYDGKKLCYAYSTNPQSDDGATAGSNFTKVSSPAKFSGAGYNVKMKVDTDGGIHLAFFTTSGAKLRYAYAPNYTGNFTVVEVDNYSLTTNDIGLDVAKDASENLVPYISYLSGNQLAKVAYPVAWNAGVATKDGISNSKYTGDWELAIIPSEGYSTTNTYDSKTSARNTTLDNLQPKFDTICVGVHKDWSTGTIAAIPAYDTKINISNDDNDSNYSTRIGGNGTSYPALAYTVIGDDSLQFAQMR